MHFQAFAGRMIETAHEFMALTWKVLPFFLIGAIAGVGLLLRLLVRIRHRLGGSASQPPPS